MAKISEFLKIRYLFRMLSSFFPLIFIYNIEKNIKPELYKRDVARKPGG